VKERSTTRVLLRFRASWLGHIHHPTPDLPSPILLLTYTYQSLLLLDSEFPLASPYALALHSIHEDQWALNGTLSATCDLGMFELQEHLTHGDGSRMACYI
jgi:hypothetical protein